MNSCELEAVLVTADPVVVDSVSESLGKLGITPNVYGDALAAMQTLNTQKTDAFLVDRELDPEFSILKAMRRSTSSRFSASDSDRDSSSAPGAGQCFSSSFFTTSSR